MRINFQNGSSSSTKQFLVELSKLYDKICDSLDKITSSQKINKNRISKAIEKSVVSSSLDRKVRLDNQVKLFQETLNLIQAYLNHKKGVKKSDVAMNFSMVSEIITKRIAEQLVLDKTKKGQFLEMIQLNKQEYLQFFQGKNKKKQQQKQLNSSRKITDQYVLKYTYTEFTRPTTAAISRIQSSTHTPDIRTFGVQTNKNLIQSNENSILTKTKPKRRVTENSLLGSKESKLYRYNKTFCPTDGTKKINNFTLTQSQSSIILQGIQKKSKQKNESYLQPKNLENADNTQKVLQKSQQDKQLLMSIESQALQEKKSLYYASQNYLKSRKNIQTITLLSHKKKHKVSACFERRQQITQDGQQYNMNFKDGHNYKSRKIVTRKQIDDDEDKYQNLVKSQKSIPRCSNTVIYQAIQNSKNRGSPSKVSKKSKMKQNSQLPAQAKSLKRIYPQRKTMIPFIGQNIGIVGLQGTTQLKQTKPNPEAKSFAEIYAQLINIRSDIKDKTDYQFRTFSNFFHQQVLLQQEENRRIQNILKQSKNYCYIQQFQMLKQITKHPKRPHQYREEAFIAGIRGHLKACNVLGQIGPANEF